MYINPLLFAYREVRQDLRFFPFRVLYDRTVWVPMMIIKEMWTQDIHDEEIRNTYHYMIELRERVDETCQLDQS